MKGPHWFVSLPEMSHALTNMVPKIGLAPCYSNMGSARGDQEAICRWEMVVEFLFLSTDSARGCGLGHLNGMLPLTPCRVHELRALRTTCINRYGLRCYSFNTSLIYSLYDKQEGNCPRSNQDLVPKLSPLQDSVFLLLHNFLFNFALPTLKTIPGPRDSLRSHWS